jgi:hypothetical protein
MRRLPGGGGAPLPPEAPWVMLTDCPPISSTALRGVLAGFASKANVTAPIPDPLAPLVTEIHVACGVDDQPHCVPVTMLTVRLPETGSTVKLVGVTLYVQLPASCETDTVCPAMVRVPVRGAPVEFCSTASVTDPMPDPAAPLLTVIQLAALTAVQEHCVPVMMLSVRRLAVDPTANVVGFRVYVHCCASASDVPASQARTTSAQQRVILMGRPRNAGEPAGQPVCGAQSGPFLRRPKRCQFAPIGAGKAVDRAGIVSEITTSSGSSWSLCTMSP